MRINSISNNQYNISNQKTKQNMPASFKGLQPEPVVNGLSKFYSKVAATKPFQNFIKNFSKSDKTFIHVMVAESIFLSGFYMFNTLKNKKIEKEQKPQMVINDALTLGVSAAGSYLVDDKITNAVVKASEKYFTKHGDFYMDLGKKAQNAFSPKVELLDKVKQAASKSGQELSQGIDDVTSTLGMHLKSIISKDGVKKAFQISPDKFETVKSQVAEAVKSSGSAEKAVEKVKGLVDDVYDNVSARAEADKTFAGINKLKVIVILGLIYRFLGPVVITPIANKLSSKFFAQKNQKTEQAKK